MAFPIITIHIFKLFLITNGSTWDLSSHHDSAGNSFTFLISPQPTIYLFIPSLIQILICSLHRGVCGVLGTVHLIAPGNVLLKMMLTFFATELW